MLAAPWLVQANTASAWRRIPSTPYECSRDGLIRHAVTEHVLRQYPGDTGTCSYVKIYVAGSKTNVRRPVSNLVAMAWLPADEREGLALDPSLKVVKEGSRVMHIDGDPRNASASNLQVVPRGTAFREHKRRREMLCEQGDQEAEHVGHVADEVVQQQAEQGVEQAGLARSSQVQARAPRPSQVPAVVEHGGQARPGLVATQSTDIRHDRQEALARVGAQPAVTGLVWPAGFGRDGRKA